MSQLEKQIRIELDSVTDSNLKKVQNTLIALFKKADSDFESLSKYGKLALKLAKNLDDDNEKLLLLTGALEMEWPEYLGGDGYWSEPSDLSVATTLLGQKSGNTSLFEFSKKLNPCKALAFFDLGLVANNSASPSQVMFATRRSPVDPVLAISSVSESLNTKQIAEIFEKIEEGVWLAAVLFRANGWTWPEWQEAFDQVSKSSSITLAFAETLLKEVAKSKNEDSTALEWIPEFIEEYEDWDGLDEEPSRFLELVESNTKLLKLAKNSHWEGLIDGLAENFSDEVFDGEPETLEDLPTKGFKLPKFCTNCGIRFIRNESKFCGECGTPR